MTRRERILVRTGWALWCMGCAGVIYACTIKLYPNISINTTQTDAGANCYQIDADGCNLVCATPIEGGQEITVAGQHAWVICPDAGGD